jgi:hypothetical protein
MHTVFLDAYSELGAEGGGTLQLEAGYYQFNETTVFSTYGNISIQGAGIGKTILTPPPSPVGTFRAPNGTLVSTFNTTTGRAGAPTFTSANLFTFVSYIYNFEMCNLTIDVQANNASEDWSGSAIFDTWGGVHHVYSDISLIGFYGPVGNPDGLHIAGFDSPGHMGGPYSAMDYVVDDLYATNDSWPSPEHTFLVAGPDYLDTGDVASCTEENISGIGDFEYEVAPSVGCIVANVHNSGPMLIDPASGGSDPSYHVPPGSWGGSVFQNVTIDDYDTGGPHALEASVANGTVGGYSDFSSLRWNDDRFYGVVPFGNNMVDVTNSTFRGGINRLPAIFQDNVVTWIPSLWGRDTITMPIVADGGVYTAPGTTSVVSGDTFIFPNVTKSGELLLLDAPNPEWTEDTLEIEGGGSSYVMAAPGAALPTDSTITGLTYEPVGGGAPPNISLLNIRDSPGFTDLGATVGGLTSITDNIPAAAGLFAAPTHLSVTAIGVAKAELRWNNPLTTRLTDDHVYVYGSGCSPFIAEYDELAVVASAMVDSLAWDTQYCFSVSASNASGQSALAYPVSAYPLAIPNTPPSVPAFYDPTGSSVELLWTQGLFGDNSTVVNDTVLVGRSCGTWEEIRSTGGAATRYNLTGLTSSVTYCVAVEAWNASAGLVGEPGSFTVGSTSGPSGPPTITVWIAIGCVFVILGVVTIWFAVLKRRPKASNRRTKFSDRLIHR